MLVLDVNVLLYAHREDSIDEHRQYADWLTELATGREAFALSTLALVGVVRIATNRRAFDPPSTHDEVFGFLDQLVSRPTARIIAPGPAHLEIFEELCRLTGAAGKLVADAQHAAVAIEHGCTMVTTDPDFARFRALRSLHPLRPRDPAP